MTESIDQLLNQLHDNAALDFTQARAMPKGVYTHPGFLAKEQEHIFSKEWICVGRQDAAVEAGDFFTCEVAGEPIVVLRDKEKRLRAFSNVCRHRLAILKNGRGNCRTMVCPYHGWAYDLTGKLMGAPHMQHSPDFNKDEYQLPEIRLEIWQGWVYLTLNADSVPVAEQLASLYDKIHQYGMEDYVETFRETHVWDTNWKILAENFMESYHLPVLHRNTVGPHSKVSDMECPPGEPAYNYHWIRKEASLAIGNAHPDNTRLEGDWRYTTALIAIYPGHLITLTPGYFWYLSLQPLAENKVQILYGGGLSPEFMSDPEGVKAIEQLKVLLDEVNVEDRVGVEAVYAGAQSQHAKPGHLCYLERPNYDFANYLSAKLPGKPSDPLSDQQSVTSPVV